MEHYQSIGNGGLPLYMAINATNELLGIEAKSDNGDAPQEVPTAAQNDASMAELERMMSGIGNG